MFSKPINAFYGGFSLLCVCSVFNNENLQLKFQRALPTQGRIYSMAILKTIYRYRYGVVSWGILECLLFSAIVYGWASLVFVLKEESFFCIQHFSNLTINESSEDCSGQDDLLNLAFTTGVFSFTSFGVFAGALLDSCGPRVTRLTACVIFALTGVIFGLMDKDRPMLLFPGIIGLTTAGILQFITLMQISLLFERWRSLITSLINGALDSSSIILLFFKIIHDYGVHLKWIFIAYFVLAVTFTFIFTFVLPAKLIDEDEIAKLSGNVESAEDSLIEEYQKCEESDSESDPVKQLFKETDSNRPEMDTEQGSFQEYWEIVTSPMYLLLVMYLSVHKLRLWFFMGSIHSFLQFTSGNNNGLINMYLNSFGIIQFAGILFSPLVGLVMSWRPEGMANKTFGFVVAICLTNSLNLILNIVVVIPVLQIQVVSFIVQVVLRAFLYSTYAAFILHRFPHKHCGKLYGTGHFIGAIFGALQFSLFVLVHSKLQGNPFWVNIGFLVFTLILYVFPFYIWVVTERETNETYPNKKCQRLEK